MSAGLDERLLLRLAVEEFLYEEAALLDGWRLDDWFELFAPDGRFIVPATDALDGDPATALTIIDDDFERLEWRVKRLKSRHAHREYPWSRTRRVITNVRITEDRGTELDVEANIVVYRFRYRRADHFVGRYRHTLIRDGDSFKFRVRRCELDMETLSPNGALSMVF